ncbi:MAG: hypothetical protein ACD_62C00170G0006 [uncultured bacterium]|nr:MAG: hypothetical protein ACD_62C00170G0006 [uncultured bacterium]HLD44621.1 hypothetical protein [bacterium]
MRLTQQEFATLRQSIIDGNGATELSKMLCLSETHQQQLIEALFTSAQAQTTSSEPTILFIVSALPFVPQSRQFAYLMRLIPLFGKIKDAHKANLRNLIDEEVANNLRPLEQISLAHELSNLLKDSNPIQVEIALGGLVKIIPQLHLVNQKEFLHDILDLSQQSALHELTREALTALLLSLESSHCADLALFFADLLKKENWLSRRYFIIDLLKQIVSLLPENDRLMLADQVAPMIYFSDMTLVKKTISFFATTISLLPITQRFYYAQMIASLINDYNMRADVIDAVEKAIPHLANEHEKLLFLELLSQFQPGQSALLETDHAYIPVYYRSGD